MEVQILLYRLVSNDIALLKNWVHTSDSQPEDGSLLCEQNAE